MAKFYITTAIDYANSTPHLGTAYEKIGADVIARYRRLQGDEVFFVMGNDEHSQNVRRKAVEQGKDPKAFCDEMAEKFQSTWKALHISNDRFIRTTEQAHHNTVRELAGRIYAARDSKGQPIIYKAPYEGPYCVSCEAFYKEADLLNGLCPSHKIKPEWIREENYFFRLSSFQGAIRKLFDEQKDFLRPRARRNEILQLLEKGLEDISVSRAGTQWGVKLPFDENAVAYVWFDALINYLSALSPIGGPLQTKFWPADLHVIGKDITRFHCVIWPAMLLAAGLPVPRGVWAHGFVSLRGEKMSKTRGNIADPNQLAAVFGADALRYHLMREVPWDGDGDFSEERIVTRFNADLANDLGNLLSRTVSMIKKYIGSELKRPKQFSAPEELNLVKEVLKNTSERMEAYEIAPALEEVWRLVGGSNLLIDRMQPWSLGKDPKNRPQLEELFYVVLERLRWAGVLLYPVMPTKMTELLGAIGCSVPEKGPILSRLEPPGEKPSYTLGEAKHLFQRIEVPKH